MNLWHFTCDHGAERIEAEGFVRPITAWSIIDDMLGMPTGLEAAPAVYWATPIPTPDREALGLTSRTLSCDRMAYRFVIDNPPIDVMPWMIWAAMHGARRQFLRTLPGRPDQWYVGTTPARAILMPCDA